MAVTARYPHQLTPNVTDRDNEIVRLIAAKLGVSLSEVARVCFEIGLPKLADYDAAVKAYEAGERAPRPTQRGGSRSGVARRKPTRRSTATVR